VRFKSRRKQQAENSKRLWRELKEKEQLLSKQRELQVRLNKSTTFSSSYVIY